MKRYTLHGKVISLNSRDHTAMIDGEKIPGWMDAMTMDYPIKNDADWKLLKPGEKITATIAVSGLDYDLENVKVNQNTVSETH